MASDLTMNNCTVKIVGMNELDDVSWITVRCPGTNFAPVTDLVYNESKNPEIDIVSGGYTYSVLRLTCNITEKLEPLCKWYNEISDNAGTGSITKRNIEVTFFYAQADTPTEKTPYLWTFYECFPVMIPSLTLKSGTSALVEMEVGFTYSKAILTPGKPSKG